MKLRRGVLLVTLVLLVSVVHRGDAAAVSSGHRSTAPFVALAAGHTGEPYSDQVSDSFDSPCTSFQMLVGTLPPGLALDPATGRISGTPSAPGVAALRIGGTTATGQSLAVRASLPIFTAQETEVVRGQSFLAQGPYAVTQLNDTFGWTSSFDGSAQSSSALIFVPQTAGKLPLLVFHYGRGFTYTDYPGFLSRIASWGVVVATMSDLGSFGGTNPTYDSGRPELGMESASAAQEAVMDYVLDRSATPGDALAGVVDPEAVFISGHSRGGGATHGSHVRSTPLRAKGVVYFMPFDLRYFQECIPPGTAPAYGIPTAQDRLPSLIISAGDDGDLVYPYADQLIDRATGPTTFVTVNGACHDYLSDTHNSERTSFGGPIPAGDIDRATEQSIIASWVVAFIRRWAKNDLSLEALLYGDEAAASGAFTVASWRRSSPTILVDDFRDADPTTNVLGGANAATGMSRAEETVYPALGDFASLGIKHSVMSFTANASTYATDLGPTGKTLDLTGCATFLARVSAPATVGGPWSYAGPAPGNGYELGFWLRLTDAQGVQASVKVANEDGTTIGYLPGRSGAGAAMPPCDRFSTLAVPLARFTQASPSLDLAHARRLELVFATAPGSPTIIAVGDLRFEGGAVQQVVVSQPPLAVVGAASGGATVAPDSLASAYGQSLQAVTGASVLTVIDSAGTARTATLIYASPAQINFLVPAGTATGTAQVTVTNGAGVVSRGTVVVASVAPGVFSADSSGKGLAAAQVVTVAANGTQTIASDTVPIDFSTAAQVYLVLYGTGLRAAASVTVTANGIPCQVTYAGAQPTDPGLDQVNVVLPSSLAGSGTAPIQVTADGIAANVVTIDVR